MAGGELRTGLVADLELGYGDGFRIGMSLSIPPGRTAALLGPNGAGKSTVVAALAGLLPLESGRIQLDGSVLDEPAREIFVPPERRNLGVVFQDYALFPHMSVLENVAFGLRSRGMSRELVRARVESWLQALDLQDLASRKPGDLSGGQAQRVALARALVIEPDLLLLDEPLAAIDVGRRSSLRRRLGEHLDGFDGPRLLITHDSTDAFLLADEVLVIEDGVITQRGSADEIRLRPRTPYAASFAGANLVAGQAADGRVEVGEFTLQIADHRIEGSVLAIIRPAAISVHVEKPRGSPRNTWQTKVEVLEHLGDVVRIRTGQPLPLTVEITEDAVEALGIRSGSPIWVSIKATEIVVEPET